MKHDEERVDFGFQTVPAAEKARRVGRVFESVAQRYDVMTSVARVDREGRESSEVA